MREGYEERPLKIKSGPGALSREVSWSDPSGSAKDGRLAE